jgi:hypothetical protein
MFTKQVAPYVLMNLPRGALIIFLFFYPAFAAQPYVHMHVFTDSSCGAWVKSSGEEYQAKMTRQIYLHWFRGFVTGHNFANPEDQVQRLPNMETLSLYVEKYCRDNPLHPFTAAAFRLVEELREKPSSQSK